MVKLIAGAKERDGIRGLVLHAHKCLGELPDVTWALLPVEERGVWGVGQVQGISDEAPAVEACQIAAQGHPGHAHSSLDPTSRASLGKVGRCRIHWETSC